jgi:hypothetical protein
MIWSRGRHTNSLRSALREFYPAALVAFGDLTCGVALEVLRVAPTHELGRGLFEHLRGTALGFRNLTNYIARCLLEAGGFRPQLHPRL